MTENTWDLFVEQINDMLGTDSAVLDKYGMVLASRMSILDKGKLVSPLLWSTIQQREKLREELVVEEIDSLIVSTGDSGFIVITFGENVYLVSLIPKEASLNEVIQSMNKIILSMDKQQNIAVKLDFTTLDLTEEFNMLSQEMDDDRNMFPVFPHLIKHMKKKKKTA